MPYSTVYVCSLLVRAARWLANCLQTCKSYMYIHVYTLYTRAYADARSVKRAERLLGNAHIGAYWTLCNTVYTCTPATWNRYTGKRSAFCNMTARVLVYARHVTAMYMYMYICTCTTNVYTCVYNILHVYRH